MYIALNVKVRKHNIGAPKMLKNYGTNRFLFFSPKIWLFSIVIRKDIALNLLCFSFGIRSLLHLIALSICVAIALRGDSKHFSFSLCHSPYRQERTTTIAVVIVERAITIWGEIQKRGYCKVWRAIIKWKAKWKILFHILGPPIIFSPTVLYKEAATKTYINN